MTSAAETGPCSLCGAQVLKVTLVQHWMHGYICKDKCKRGLDLISAKLFPNKK